MKDNIMAIQSFQKSLNLIPIKDQRKDSGFSSNIYIIKTSYGYVQSRNYISLEYTTAQIFYYRGLAKHNLNDDLGCVEDLKIFLKIDYKENLNAKLVLGESLYNLQHYSQAKMYLTYVITHKAGLEDALLSEAYFARGLANYGLRQNEQACSDLSRSGELGYSKAYDYIKKYCH